MRPDVPDDQRPETPEESTEEQNARSRALPLPPEDRLRLLEENVRDYALIVTDTDGQVVGWNVGAEAIFGWTEAEAVGLSLEAIFTPQDRDGGVPAQEMGRAARVGRSDDDRWLGRRDGSLFWARGVLMALRDHDGGLRGYAKILSDQTKQRNADAELAAARAQAQVQERTSHLLAVGDALGGALTTREVADVILQAALPILRASMGLVVLLSGDGTTLRTVHVVGVPPHLSDPWREFPVDAPVPLADAVRERRLVLVPLDAQPLTEVPELAGMQVAVPLMVAARCVGGLGLICPPEYCQDEGQIAFLWTLAGQCALALERARLYDDARREVAERLRVEEALRESEGRFRGIIDASQVAYALNDEEGRITFLNAEFVRAFGYTRDDIPTLADWWPLAYPDPAYRRWVTATWQDRLDRAKQEGTSFETVELTIRCKDGAERTVLAGASPLGASFAGTHLVSFYDITDRKRAEDERARLVEYNRLLLDSTAEGIYGMDTGGRCAFLNRAATRLLGYEAEEAVGMDMHALIHHSRSDGTPYPVEECPIYLALQRGLPCHSEAEVLWRRDGTCFPASYSSHPITDAGGILGAVVTFSDITERRRMEQERAAHLLEAEERADRDPADGAAQPPRLPEEAGGGGGPRQARRDDAGRSDAGPEQLQVLQRRLRARRGRRGAETGRGAPPLRVPPRGRAGPLRGGRVRPAPPFGRGRAAPGDRGADSRPHGRPGVSACGPGDGDPDWDQRGGGDLPVRRPDVAGGRGSGGTSVCGG